MNKVEKGPVIMLKGRIVDYVLIHLGDMGSSTSEITDDIQELLAHPDRNAGIESRLEVCRKLAKENLAYISQGLCDLREFENTDGVKN
jgi:hypothetical protein